MKTDAEAKKEYYEMNPIFVYISPKERKVKTVIALLGHDKKYWLKLTSKQLGGVLKNLINQHETRNTTKNPRDHKQDKAV